MKTLRVNQNTVRTNFAAARGMSLRLLLRWKFLTNSLSLLLMLVWTPLGRAQPLVDCNCVGHLSVLFTNSCQGIIPDLCALSQQCWVAGIPLLCSQSPLPGGSVGP